MLFNLQWHYFTSCHCWQYKLRGSIYLFIFPSVCLFSSQFRIDMFCLLIIFYFLIIGCINLCLSDCPLLLSHFPRLSVQRLSVCLSVFLFNFLFINLMYFLINLIYRSIDLSIYLSIYQFICDFNLLPNSTGCYSTNTYRHITCVSGSLCAHQAAIQSQRLERWRLMCSLHSCGSEAPS